MSFGTTSLEKCLKCTNGNQFIRMHHFEKLKFVAKLHNSDNVAIKICLVWLILVIHS